MTIHGHEKYLHLVNCTELKPRFMSWHPTGGLPVKPLFLSRYVKTLILWLITTIDIPVTILTSIVKSEKCYAAPNHFSCFLVFTTRMMQPNYANWAQLSFSYRMMQMHFGETRMDAFTHSTVNRISLKHRTPSKTADLGDGRCKWE